MGTFLVFPGAADQDCCKEKDDCHFDMEITNPSSPSDSGPETNLAEDERKPAAIRDFFTSKNIKCFISIKSLSLSL